MKTTDKGVILAGDVFFHYRIQNFKPGHFCLCGLYLSSQVEATSIHNFSYILS